MAQEAVPGGDDGDSYVRIMDELCKVVKATLKEEMDGLRGETLKICQLTNMVGVDDMMLPKIQEIERTLLEKIGEVKTDLVKRTEGMENVVLERIAKLETNLIKEVNDTIKEINQLTGQLQHISSDERRRFHIELGRFLLTVAAIGGSLYLLFTAGKNAGEHIKRMGEHAKLLMTTLEGAVKDFTKKGHMVKGPILSLWSRG